MDILTKIATSDEIFNLLLLLVVLIHVMVVITIEAVIFAFIPGGGRH